MKKRHVDWLGLLLLYCISVCLPLTVQSQNFDSKMTFQKFAAAIQIIRYAYVDTVNEPKLTDAALTEMLKELDPHSVYIPKAELNEANEPLTGFEGIGVQFQIFKDTILVVGVIVGGPSEKVGIMAGDKIIKINGEDAFGKKISNKLVMEKLRGKKGSQVKVGIFRKGRKSLLDFTITRDKISPFSIDAAFMATPQIGYIKLSRFSESSTKEFLEALDKLKAKGMKNLILDLRGNGGGYMNIALDLANQFIEKNKLLLYTEGLRSARQDFYSDPNGKFVNGKLIILINEGSASASEIVAGAVQDLDRGLIVGRRSFGKGLVQRPFMLPDSSVIRLTTARYHTPTGRCIQKSYASGVDDYYEDLYKRFKHGELLNSDSIHFPDSLKYYTPAKRVVYGGGGIMPDVFIPWDSTKISDYYADLIRKGILNQFTTQYVEDHRAEFKNSYPDLKSFSDGFQTDQGFLKQFTDFAEKEGVKMDEKGFQTSEKYIKLVLKGLIARNLFEISSYYEMVSPLDEELQKSIELLKDDALFKKLKIKS